MKFRSHVAPFAATFAALTAAAPASAQNVSRILSTTTGGIAGLSDVTAPALNNAGVVAFTAQNNGSQNFVYKADGSGATTLVASPIAFGPTPQFGRVAVNDSGLVAYTTTRFLNIFASVPGVFTGFSESQGTTLLQEATESISNVSVNNGGVVSFDFFTRVGLGYSTAVRRGTTSANITDAGSGAVFVSGSGFTSGDAVGRGALNNAGSVLYLRNGPNFPPGAATRVDAQGNAVTFSPPPGTSFFSGAPSLNDSGAFLIGGLTGNSLSLYSADASGQYTTVATPSAGFTSFSDWSLNNVGTAAFTATSGGVEGLYLALSGGAPSPVFRVGQSLFGSTITELQLHRDGLNDNGDVAFRYALSNGERGIAVVSAAPEPGAAALLAAAGLPLVGLAARRRRMR